MHKSTTETPQEFQFNNERVFCDLVVQWREHQRVGIELRHQTGEFLLEELGSAKKNRQKYGEKVIPRVADELGIAVSEVSRMRKFAEKFANFEQFREEHPECKTWSAVKKILPDRSQSDSTTGTKDSNVPRPVTGGQVENSAVDLIDKLERLDAFSGRGFEKVPDILTRVIEVATSKLQAMEEARGAV